MLFHLLAPLQDSISFFRIFQYITFRSAYAIMTALVVSFILTPFLIEWLRRLRFREIIRQDGPQSHQVKAGTPTMGGIALLLSMMISTALWANFKNYYVVLLIVAIFLFGAIGFIDDYMKSVLHISQGMRPRVKFLLQICVATFASIVIFYFPSNPVNFAKVYVPFVNESLWDMSAVYLPFLSSDPINLTWLYIVFSVWIMVGTSNAVNLTDGLDGLAIGNSLIVVSTLTLLAYVSGHSVIAKYLIIPYTPHAAEITVVLAAFLGAGLGFLWYNANPAQLFMGDTGSLAIGGMIGIVAVMIKKEFLLVIIGGVFVLEAVSVILQVAFFKWKGKRIFKMAPIHHHFELLGWKETKIVTRFWILGLILALFALSSLKIR